MNIIKEVLLRVFICLAIGAAVAVGCAVLVTLLAAGFEVVTMLF